jgi:hypothetical protein
VAFCAALRDQRLTYDEVADYEEAHGRPRPSALDRQQLEGLFRRLVLHPEGRHALETWLGQRASDRG